jgi:hypothetical protein
MTEYIVLNLLVQWFSDYCPLRCPRLHPRTITYIVVWTPSSVLMMNLCAEIKGEVYSASSRHFYKGAVPFWHQGAPLCSFTSQGAPWILIDFYGSNINLWWPKVTHLHVAKIITLNLCISDTLGKMLSLTERWPDYRLTDLELAFGVLVLLTDVFTGEIPLNIAFRLP